MSTHAFRVSPHRAQRAVAGVILAVAAAAAVIALLAVGGSATPAGATAARPVAGAGAGAGASRVAAPGVPAGYVRDPQTHQLLKVTGAASATVVPAQTTQPQNLRARVIH